MPAGPTDRNESIDDLFVLASQPHLKPGALLRAALECALEPEDGDTGGAIFSIAPDATEPIHAANPRLGASTTRIAELADAWQRQLKGALNSPHLLYPDTRTGVGFPLVPRQPQAGALWIETSRGRLGRERCRSLERLASSVGILLDRLRVRDHAAQRGLEVQIVGRSPAILRMEEEVRAVASDPQAPVLIRGERGSGKELVAYAIHYFGQRRDRPFLPVNSAALSDTLYADELFGHERSSFTGADRSRPGLLRKANGGTLFLDELGDMPLAIQATLLRVIDQGELRSIGCDEPETVDVRFVAATNKDLESMVAEGTFRSDLYDRLNVFTIRVPSLRERLDDVALLSDYFLKKLCIQRGRHRRSGNADRCCQCLGLPGAACARPGLFRELADYDYPGNVRELNSVLTRLATLVVDGELRAEHVLEHLRPSGRPSTTTSGDDLSLDTALREHIGIVLDLAQGNKSQAARLLGLPLTTLINKMKRLGMQ